MITAYPLHWPVDYKRSQQRKNSRFKTTLGRARDVVIKELDRINAQNVIISTNIPLKQNGDMYADWQRYRNEDTGVAVYFTRNKQQIVLCCDTYTHIWENMHAIGRTLEALRQIDRDGVSDFLNRTFTGFKALPESTSTKPWYQVLIIPEDSSPLEIRQAFHRMAKLHHPDNGGNADTFNMICEAYKTGMAKNNLHIS